jgi:hypothetical protein
MKNSKIILLILSLLTSTLIFSQRNETNFKEYYLNNFNDATLVYSPIKKSKHREYSLIDKLNDTTLVYGKILSIENLQSGFKIFDENGNKTKQKVNPDLFKYLLYHNRENKKIILKSLPLKREPAFLFYEPTNVFMSILIENSEEDIEKGKIDFYIHEFSVGSPTSFGPNGFSGYTTNDLQRYYFKDLNGLHQIKKKSQFKNFPELLGVELYKKMRKSDKERKQFLLDYFTEYNNSVSN